MRWPFRGKLGVKSSKLIYFSDFSSSSFIFTSNINFLWMSKTAGTDYRTRANKWRTFIQEKTFWRDHAPSNRERLQYQKKFFEKIKPSNREYLTWVEHLDFKRTPYKFFQWLASRISHVLFNFLILKGRHTKYPNVEFSMYSLIFNKNFFHYILTKVRLVFKRGL